MLRKKGIGSRYRLAAGAILFGVHAYAGPAMGQSRAAGAVGELLRDPPGAQVLWTGGGFMVCEESAGSRPCLPDVNFDGALDVFDHLTFQELFTSGDAAADFTGDGVLDVRDFLAFGRLFEEGC